MQQPTRLRRWTVRLAVEWRALIELYLLPALVGLLPQRQGAALGRRLARIDWLYRAEWTPALAQAPAFVTIDDHAEWAQRYRFTRLIDHADFYRSLLRSRASLVAELGGDGRWPSLPGGAVGVFFHWCANLPAVYSLAQSSVNSSVLAGRFSRRSMGGALLGYWYGRIRIDQLERASGGPLIYAPRTVQQSLQALAAGRWVIGTPDVPPSETRIAVPVDLFDRRGHMPEGLLLIARQAAVPVVIFTLALDYDSGRRELQVLGPFDPADPALMQRIASLWESLIREKSWGFTLWPAMPAFFPESQAAAIDADR